MIKELDIVARWKAQINWEKDFGWTKELDAVEKALSKLQESNRWISDSLLEYARNYIKKA